MVYGAFGEHLPIFSFKNTIVKLAGNENIGSIHVKMKYKTASTGKLKWWYIIHAEEDSILKPCT